MRLNQLTTRALVMAGSFALLSACGSQPEQSSELEIIGGEEVPASQNDARRWSTVALTTDKAVGSSTTGPLQDGHSFCSGTIIGKRTIMTAAHCLQSFDQESGEKGDLLLENVADYKVSFDIRVSMDGNYIQAEQVIPHPAWDPPASLDPQSTVAPNDLGLIILAEDIPETAMITPIKSADDDISGATASMVGFGVSLSRTQNDTGVLRQIELPIQEVNTGRKIVTLGELFQGACGGDSGGPLYVQGSDGYELVGATSTGADLLGLLCLGMMSNYTDVRHFANWIADMSDDL